MLWSSTTSSFPVGSLYGRRREKGTKSFASDRHKFQFATLASSKIIHKIFLFPETITEKKEDEEENFDMTAEILCAPRWCSTSRKLRRRKLSSSLFFPESWRNILLTLIETLEDSINCNFMFIKMKQENSNFSISLDEGFSQHDSLRTTTETDNKFMLKTVMTIILLPMPLINYNKICY